MAIVMRTVCYALAVLSVSFLGIQYSAFAQTPNALIDVPAILKIDAGNEGVLPIKLSPISAIPDQAIVLIRGMPATSRLSEGRLFPSGVWAVKPSVAPELKLTTRADTYEDTHLIVSLVTLEGEYLSNATVHLMVAPPKAPGEQGVAEVDGEDSDVIEETVATIAVETDLSKEAHVNARGEAGDIDPQGRLEPLVLRDEEINKILKIMMKGDQYLVEGKIAAARRFYEHAAEMGWPDGAAAIGRTYDPDHLSRFPILGGIQPDAALAKDWYAKARELNSRVKVDDLQKTGQR